VINFQNSFTDTIGRKFAIKQSLQILLHYLVKIKKIKKLHRPKARQLQTKRARTEEKMTEVDELVRPATNSSFNTPNSTICYRTDHFYRDLRSFK